MGKQLRKERRDTLCHFKLNRENHIMNCLRIILALVLAISFDHCLARRFNFPRKRGKAIMTSSRQTNGNWKDVAETAFCSSHDSSRVMDSLIAVDKRSHWFVLVSPYKQSSRRRGRREARGKGWSADFNSGELHTSERCGATLVVWRGEIGLDKMRTRGCDTRSVRQLLQLQGNLKSDQDRDIDLVRKEISLRAGKRHHFFIMWQLAKGWKWSSYGMGITESECLVHNSNSFFCMEPEQRKIEKTGGPYLKSSTTTTKATATTPTASKTECSPADVVSLRSGNPNCKPAEEIPEDCPPEQNVVAGVVTVKSGNINCKSVSDLVVKYDGIEDLLDLRTTDI